MPRGGKRPGAGRKKGSGTKKTKKTNQLAAQAAGEGVLPLQVMLEAMRELYRDKDLQGAAKVATQAAPYVHPRLNSTKHSGAMRHIHSVEDLSDDELAALAGEGEGAA